MRWHFQNGGLYNGAMIYSTAISKRKAWWNPILCAIALVISACSPSQDNPILSGTPSVYAQGGSELARNTGFEESGSPVPRYWTWDQQQSGNKGTVTLDQTRHRSGRSALKLSPNSRNAADNPLGITQIIPAAQYRGKQVEFSGYMITEGNTQGILAMLSIVRGAATNGPEMLFQNPGAKD